MNTKSNSILLAVLLLGSWAMVLACKAKHAPAPVLGHLAEAGWRGSAGIYADRVPNKAILQGEGLDTGKTFFYCLRIGLCDSTDNRDAKQEAAKEKYYQLEMYKDWVLLNGGDSIVPVFYQPVPQKEHKLAEQVLVYELPKGFRPSTLVYKDPYGLLGQEHVLFLNKNNP